MFTKTMKKAISVSLVLCIVLSLFAAYTFGATAKVVQNSDYYAGGYFVMDFDDPAKFTEMTSENTAYMSSDAFSPTVSDGALHITTAKTEWALPDSAQWRSGFAVYNQDDGCYQFRKGVTYTITVRYKQTIKDDDSSKVGRLFLTYGQNQTKAQNQTAKFALFANGFYEYGTTGWMTKTYTFTAGESQDKRYLTVVPVVSSGSQVTFDIDYIKVTTAYAVDFDDASVYDDWMNDVRTASSYVNAASQVAWKVEDGVLCFPTVHKTAPSTSTTQWVQRFAVSNGSAFAFDKSQNYRVTVRYKQETDSATTGRFSLGSNASAWNASGAVKSYEIFTATGTTDWMIKTVYIKGADVPTDGDDLSMTFGSSSGNEVKFYVDYLVIESGIFTVDCGTKGTITDYTVGEELPAPAARDGMNFLGWYTDASFTEKYGAVKENETRIAYAKWDKTLLTFTDNALFEYRCDQDETKMKTEIITDPENDGNGVLYLWDYDNYALNFIPRAYEDESVDGYKVVPGGQYKVSFKYKLAPHSQFKFRILLGNACQGTKRGVSRAVLTLNSTENSRKTNTTDEISEWYTYTTTFTAPDDIGDKTYLTIAHFDGVDKTERGVYIDDVMIEDLAVYQDVKTVVNGVAGTVSAPVGKELDALPDTDDSLFIGWFEDEGGVTPFGVVLADEQRTAYAVFKAKETVTLNINGIVTTEYHTVGDTLSDATSTEEMTFAGWYSDPAFTNAFGTVRENETRTAYAKFDIIQIRFNNVSVSETNAEVVADPGNTDNKALHITGAAKVGVKAYDAAGAADYALAANTLYVVRFRYKAAKGTDGAKLALGVKTQSGTTVSNNVFTVPAVAADAVTSWEAGALLVSASEASTLVLAQTEAECDVYVDDLRILKADTAATVSVVADGAFTPASTATVGKIYALGNKLAADVTVNLGSGEQVKIDGISVKFDDFGTAFSSEQTAPVFLNANGYDVNGEGATAGNVYVATAPASAKNLKVTVTVTKSDDNLGVIASSVREKSETVRAGLRFRARLGKQTESSFVAHGEVEKVGFIITPKFIMDANSQTKLTLENAELCNAIVAECQDVVYDSNGNYTDYQLCLVSEQLDKLLDLDFTVAFYIQYADKTTVYGKEMTRSYNTTSAMVNGTSYVAGIPSFYQDEFVKTRNDLISAEENDGFSFLHITDTHIEWSDVKDAVVREFKAMVELANRSDVEAIVMGGDIIHGCDSKSKELQMIALERSILAEASVPSTLSKGNHDCNPYHSTNNSGLDCPASYIITDKEFTELFIKPLGQGRDVHDSLNKSSTYYYMDFAGSKTRLIMIDCYDFPMIITPEGYTKWVSETWNKMSDRQMKWFATEALGTVPEGWTVQIAMHGVAHAGNPGGGKFKNADDFVAIVSAYNNRTAYKSTTYDIDVNFTGITSRIEMITYGHTHFDAYYTDTAAKIVYTNTAHGKYAPAYDLGTPGTGVTAYNPVREKGTATEALFNAINCAVDGIINVYRFGAGDDWQHDVSAFMD